MIVQLDRTVGQTVDSKSRASSNISIYPGGDGAHYGELSKWLLGAKRREIMPDPKNVSGNH
jgi:hypothetical protein